MAEMYLPTGGTQQLAHILWSLASASPRCCACTLLLAIYFPLNCNSPLRGASRFATSPARLHRFTVASHKARGLCHAKADLLHADFRCHRCCLLARRRRRRQLEDAKSESVLRR